MTRTITLETVVPTSFARAKCIAKDLHRLYPQAPLNRCQHITASLLGFPDLHHLHEAVKRKNVFAAFDEACSDAALAQRRVLQAAFLCRELGDVDPDGTYAPPTKESSDIFPGVERLRLAHQRSEQLLAAIAIAELQPTAQSVQAIDATEIFSDVSAETHCSLPALLGRWWNTNVPYQLEVGRTLSAFPMKPQRASSLLAFARYWGILCVHYAQVIPWPIAVVGCYLPASRFADLYTRSLRHFPAVVCLPGHIKRERNNSRDADWLYALSDHGSLIEYFLNALARDDIAATFKNKRGGVRMDVERGLEGIL